MTSNSFGFLFAWLILFLSSPAKAVYFPGDDCDSAIVLSVGSACITQTFSTTGATHSGLPTPSCGSLVGADMWFKVQVPVSGKLQIKVQGVSSVNFSYSVYSGTCTSLNELKCNQNYAYYNLNNPAMALQDLYIRVWRTANASGGSFTICAWEPNTATNDFCSTALLLPVGTSCSMVTYNNTGCTAESTSVAGNPACGAYLGGDIWFKTVVPASGHLRIEKQNGSGIAAQSAIYSGSCGAFTLLDCLPANESYNLHNHAMAGQTIYIRVWDYAGPFSGGTFSLCVWEPSTPENDTCTNAISIPVNSNCSMTTYSNTGCTAENNSVASIPSCGAFEGADLWFKLVVPLSGHLRIEKQSTASMTAISTVYSGSCGGFTALGCIASNKAFNLHDHALAGQTIYIRVWNYGEEYNGGNFGLCAWEPVIAENDFCSQAAWLSVGNSCVQSTVGLLGLTSESTSTAPNPSCGAFSGGDIWYKVQVPASGHLRIEKENISGTSAQLSVYSGSCGAFTELNCFGGNGAYNLHNHAMAGQVLYVRVWDYGEGSGTGSFKICAWEPNTPENDFCASAIPLTTGTICTLQSFNNLACTSENSTVASNPSCGFFNGADVWFTVQVPASGHLRIERTNDVGMNAQFALYTGVCGNLTELRCANLISFINIHDHALGGQTLYLRVWNFNSNVSGNFSICAWEPAIPENDFCSQAPLLPMNYTCTLNTYSSLGCTTEAATVAPNPTCGFYIGGDLWYRFVMPASGLAAIQRVNSGPMNVQYAFYSGSCGNLTQLSCSQLTASYTLNNAALAGQTLYLRIWNYNSLEGGSFQFCLFDPSCLVQIDSIHTTPVACTLVPDGTLTVYASCTLCAGSIQYALNNGAWQNSNVFTNLPSGGYLVKARDGGKTTCFQEWSSLVIVPATQVAHAYYEDLDGDGFGKSSVSVITCGSPPPNYVSASSDCNDGNAQIYPGALEIPCNGIDENCNGMTDDVPVEITVKGNCHAITNGDSSPEPADRTDFGLLMPNEGTTQQFSITNTGLSILHVDSIRLNPGYFTFDSVLNNIQLVPFQTYYFNVHFSAPITGIHQSVIHIYNNDCDESHTAFLLQAEVQNVSISTLQLHVLIEGYMIGNTQMTAAMLNEGLNTCSNETDTIEVELHSPVDFSLQASSKTILHTDGSATCRFQNMSGNYYILVKHRNAVSTVSALPVLIQTNGSYDFTLSAASAYENNLKEESAGVFVLYSGDLNKDENVDLLDQAFMEQDIDQFQSGYFATDINGDGNVDLLDSPVMELNVSEFIYSHHP